MFSGFVRYATMPSFSIRASCAGVASADSTITGIDIVRLSALSNREHLLAVDVRQVQVEQHQLRLGAAARARSPSDPCIAGISSMPRASARGCSRRARGWRGCPRCRACAPRRARPHARGGASAGARRRRVDRSLGERQLDVERRALARRAALDADAPPMASTSRARAQPEARALDVGRSRRRGARTAGTAGPASSASMPRPGVGDQQPQRGRRRLGAVRSRPSRPGGCT